MLTRRLFNHASLLGLFNPFYPDPSPQEEPQQKWLEIYDDAVIETACSALRDGSRRKRLVGLAPKWCPACQHRSSPKNSLKSNEYFEIEWIEADDWEGVKPPQYPAVIDTETRCQFFGSVLTKQAQLQSGVLTMTADAENLFNYIDETNAKYAAQGKLTLPTKSSIIPAIGKIDRRLIEGVLKVAKASFDLSFGSGPFEYTEGSATLIVPQGTGFNYSRQKTGEAKLVFTNRPTIRLLGLIDQKIDGFTITPNSFVINLRLFPDIPVDVA